jgi:hypothetical protein
VILQQGPSALPESQVLLREYTRKFDATIRRAGAKTALYMVWPFSTRRGDFDGVKASYQARLGMLAGCSFRSARRGAPCWRRDAAISLYGSDGFHPHSGSHVSGCARDLSAAHGDIARGRARSRCAIAPDRAAVLRQAAADVIAIQ